MNQAGPSGPPANEENLAHLPGQIEISPKTILFVLASNRKFLCKFITRANIPGHASYATTLDSWLSLVAVK